MTSETLSIITMLLGAGGFLLQFNDIFNRNEINWRKRISSKGWRVICVCILTIAIGVTSLFVTKNEKRQESHLNRQQRISDSTKNSKLQSSLDSTNAELRDIKNGLSDLNFSIKKNSTGSVTIVKNYADPVEYKTCPIKIELSPIPNNEVQELCNGVKIKLQYSINTDHTITIPYMRGKTFAGSFIINGRIVDDIEFNIADGTFSVAKPGGFNNGNKISFAANIPIQKTKVCQISIELSGSPNNKNITLCNNDIIPYEYKPFSLTKIKIPYMKGKDYVGNFIFDNAVC